MSSSIATFSLLCRTTPILRLPFCRNSRSLFSSSIVSCSSSKLPTTEPTLFQNLNTTTPTFKSIQTPDQVSPDDDPKIEVYSTYDHYRYDELDPYEFELPEDFPFEIIDRPGDVDVFTLKREFEGESITIQVNIKEDLFGGHGHDIKIECREGLTMEFRYCQIYYNGNQPGTFWLKSTDEAKGLCFEFYELDKGLQDALLKCLEVRGINRSLHEFLGKYISLKFMRDPKIRAPFFKKYKALWLKNMKEYLGSIVMKDEKDYAVWIENSLQKSLETI